MRPWLRYLSTLVAVVSVSTTMLNKELPAEADWYALEADGVGLGKQRMVHMPISAADSLSCRAEEHSAHIMVRLEAGDLPAVTSTARSWFLGHLNCSMRGPNTPLQAQGSFSGRLGCCAVCQLNSKVPP